MTFFYPYLEKTTPQVPCEINISVVAEDCLVVAKSIMAKGHPSVCVLNMANQFQVGGDYLGGNDQEESLIRRTDLFDALTKVDGVIKKGTILYQYECANGLNFSKLKSGTGFGEFSCLYSPDILVHTLNSEELDEKSNFKPFSINVLSSAAYNLSDPSQYPDEKLYIVGTVFKIMNQLRTAKAHGQRHLVLGAFGCGAFRNDPSLIAEIYHSAIHEFEFQGCFDSICFAIKSNTNKHDVKYDIFSERMTRPARPLFELMSSAFKLLNDQRKENLQLDKMLAGFEMIESIEEFTFLVSRLIKNELKRLVLSSGEHELTIEFLTDLLNLLEKSPKQARNIVEEKLSDPICSKLEISSNVSFFKNSRYFMLTKLSNLLTRFPVPESILNTNDSKEKVQTL